MRSTAPIPRLVQKQDTKPVDAIITQATYYAKHPSVFLRRIPERVLHRWPGMIYRRLTAQRAQDSISAILALFPSQSRSDIERYAQQWRSNTRFAEETAALYETHRNKRLVFFEWNEFLYLAIRVLQPTVVFETGVFDGMASVCMLQALTDNDYGLLASVDLPAIDVMPDFETPLPPKCQPGWLVPEYLRDRYKLFLGDAKDLLPKMFDEYPEIDMFVHDSLHTDEHMTWEYRTAWPHIRPGRLLVSDDILWNNAFPRFCRTHEKSYVRVSGAGAVVK